MCQAVAAAQPEGVIVMDEGATAGFAYYGLAAGAPPFIYMTLTGGSIGQGLPCAVGAAAAAPDRRVLLLGRHGPPPFNHQFTLTVESAGHKLMAEICKKRPHSLLRWEI